MNWASVGSGSGLSPVRRHVIIWTNAWYLSIGLLGTHFIETQFGIQSYSFKKMHWKLSSAEMAAILSMGRWVNIRSDTGSAQNMDYPETWQSSESMDIDLISSYGMHDWPGSQINEESNHHWLKIGILSFSFPLVIIFLTGRCWACHDPKVLIVQNMYNGYNHYLNTRV